jgi:DNA-binding NarL/FixJ family response regulator
MGNHPAQSETLASPLSTGMKRHYRVLIVDDDDLIREGLAGYLENYHEADYSLSIETSASPAEAREKMRLQQEKQPFHLVISDINMPGEDGFSLIRHIRANYPEIRTAMITAYRVEEYVRNAKNSGVFNIIAKTAPFNFEELSTVVNNLLEPASAFGLERYMDPLCTLNKLVIRSSNDILVAFNTLQAFLTQSRIERSNDLLTAVIEALTNAVYHVAKLPDGSLKYEKGQPIERLDESEYVHVFFGQDLERIGISIVDQGGRITAEEVLYWLERNISGAGLMDTHGRGVYLIHRLVDRVLINIAPGRRTEIIILDYFKNAPNLNKPIYINQL